MKLPTDLRDLIFEFVAWTPLDAFEIARAADEAGILLIVPEGTVNPGGAPFWNATEFCCNFYGAAINEEIAAAGGVRSMADFVLMRRLFPPSQEATLVRGSKVEGQTLNIQHQYSAFRTQHSAFNNISHEIPKLHIQNSVATSLTYDANGERFGCGFVCVLFCCKLAHFPEKIQLAGMAGYIAFVRLLHPNLNHLHARTFRF